MATTISGSFCPACGMSKASAGVHLCTLEVIAYCRPDAASGAHARFMA